jgi:uncharacterized protein
MDGYKHIETSIAGFIAGKYQRVVEVGAGANLHTAELIQRAGVQIICTDLHFPDLFSLVPCIPDDVLSPDLSLYEGAECLYAIRPIEEMMGSLIDLARKIEADLYVYHLGFEGYLAEHQVIDCGVPLHQYHQRSIPKTEKS